MRRRKNAAPKLVIGWRVYHEDGAGRRETVSPPFGFRDRGQVAAFLRGRGVALADGAMAAESPYGTRYLLQEPIMREGW